MNVLSTALSLALALGSPRFPFGAGENLKGAAERFRIDRTPIFSGSTYAAVFQIGANQAVGLSVWTFDREGGFTGEGGGTNFPNFQDPTSSFRFIVDQSITGTVDEMDENGTGMLTPLVTTPAFGQTIPQPSQIQVTGRAIGQKGIVATAAHGASQNPGAGGNRIEFQLTKRDEGGFDNSALDGRYAAVCESGSLQGFASGTIDFDGEGGLSGALKLNDQNPEDPAGPRVNVATGVTGEYAVQDDGFLEISLTYEADGFESGPSPFVITTNTAKFPSGLLATGLAGGFAAVSPVNGGLVRCEMDYLGQAFSDDDYETTMK